MGERLFTMTSVCCPKSVGGGQHAIKLSVESKVPTERKAVKYGSDYTNIQVPSLISEVLVVCVLHNIKLRNWGPLLGNASPIEQVSIHFHIWKISNKAGRFFVKLQQNNNTNSE